MIEQNIKELTNAINNLIECINENKHGGDNLGDDIAKELNNEQPEKSPSLKDINDILDREKVTIDDVKALAKEKINSGVSRDAIKAMIKQVGGDNLASLTYKQLIIINKLLQGVK